MQLTESEASELQRRASARTERAEIARHARLILLLAEGLTWAEIRVKLDCSDSYIDRWSKRFAADRLAGLFPRHAGRERYKVTDRIEARVLAKTTKHKPADGSTHWSTRKLAAELGGDISHMTVARIWAKHGIKPHRLEGYLASNDPAFETQAAEVIDRTWIRLHMLPCSVSMRRPQFRRWIAKTRYCPSRPGAQSVTDSNISGMARCPCTRPSTLRPAKCWARPQLVTLQLNSSPFSATSLPINLAAKTFT